MAAHPTTAKPLELQVQPLTRTDWQLHEEIVEGASQFIPSYYFINLGHGGFQYQWRVRQIRMNSRLEVKPVGVTVDDQGRLIKRTVETSQLTSPPDGWSNLSTFDRTATENAVFGVLNIHKDDATETGPTRMEVRYKGSVIELAAYGFLHDITLADMMNANAACDQCVEVAYDPFRMPRTYDGPPVNTPPGAVLVSLNLETTDEVGGDGPRVKRMAGADDADARSLVVYQPPPSRMSLPALFGGFLSALMPSRTSDADTEKDRYRDPAQKITGWDRVSSDHALLVNRAAHAIAAILFPNQGEVPLEQRVSCVGTGRYNIVTFGVQRSVSMALLARMGAIAGFSSAAYSPRIISSENHISYVIGASASPSESSTRARDVPGALVIKLRNTATHYSAQAQNMSAAAAAAPTVNTPSRPGVKRSAAAAELFDAPGRD